MNEKIDSFREKMAKVAKEIEDKDPEGKDDLVRIIASLDQLKAESPEAVDEAQNLVAGATDEELKSSLESFLADPGMAAWTDEMGIPEEDVKVLLLEMGKAIRDGEDVITPLFSLIIRQGEQTLGEMKDGENQEES
jgi:hypothetical protein